MNAAKRSPGRGAVVSAGQAGLGCAAARSPGPGPPPFDRSPPAAACPGARFTTPTPPCPAARRAWAVRCPQGWRATSNLSGRCGPDERAEAGQCLGTGPVVDPHAALLPVQQARLVQHLQVVA